MTLWAAELGPGLPPVPPLDADLEISEAGPASHAALAAGMATDRALIAGRVARGSRPFGVWVGEELGAFCWVSTDREWIGEVERELLLAPRDCYIWNCVTLAPNRRRGLFRALVSEMVATARRDGFSRAWIGSVPGAAWTEPALANAGFKPVVVVRLVGLPGLGRVSLGAMPGAELSLFEAARSALALRRTSFQPRRRRHH